MIQHKCNHLQNYVQSKEPSRLCLLSIIFESRTYSLNFLRTLFWEILNVNGSNIWCSLLKCKSLLWYCVRWILRNFFTQVHQWSCSKLVTESSLQYIMYVLRYHLWTFSTNHIYLAKWFTWLIYFTFIFRNIYSMKMPEGLTLPSK